MNPQRALVSRVIPFANEKDVFPLMRLAANRLDTHLEKQGGCDVEAVVIYNGSSS